MKDILVKFIETSSFTVGFAVASDLLAEVLPTLSWTFFAATWVAFTFSVASFVDLLDYIEEYRAKQEVED